MQNFEQIDDARADARIRVLARDDHHFLQPAQRNQLADGVGRFVERVGLGGETSQPSYRLSPHVLVRIGPADVAKHRNVTQTSDRSPPHARFGVFARQQTQGVAFLWS